MPKQLIITGFHRSGTSLTAHFLMECGLFLGDRLINATPDNPYGHFEDVEPLYFHERVFSANSSNWMIAEDPNIHLSEQEMEWMREFSEKRNSQHDLWGFKDPRACFFVEKWKQVLPDCKVLVVFRNPCDCVASLERRHARQIVQKKGVAEENNKFFIEPDYALRMWCAHNNALLKIFELYKEDMFFINHQKIIRGYALPNYLNDRADLGLGEFTIDSIFDPAVTRKSMRPLLVTDSRWTAESLRIWRRLAEIESQTFSVTKSETAEELTENSFVHRPALAVIKRRKELYQSVCLRPIEKVKRELRNFRRSVSRWFNLPTGEGLERRVRRIK